MDGEELEASGQKSSEEHLPVRPGGFPGSQHSPGQVPCGLGHKGEGQ